MNVEKSMKNVSKTCKRTNVDIYVPFVDVVNGNAGAAGERGCYERTHVR